MVATGGLHCAADVSITAPHAALGGASRTRAASRRALQQGAARRPNEMPAAQTRSEIAPFAALARVAIIACCCGFSELLEGQVAL